MPHPKRGALTRTLALLWAAALPAAAVAQDPCRGEPPPAVPPSYFTVKQNTPWSKVQEFINQYRIEFVQASSDSASVVPCNGKGCEPMMARIFSERRTNCLSNGMAVQDSLRFVGLVRRYSGYDPAQLGFGSQNETDSVYLLVQDGKAIAMFRDRNGDARFVQHSSRNMGWKWRFHPEGTMFDAPEARWRPDSSLVKGLVTMAEPRGAVHGGGPSALVEDDGDAAQMGSPDYGWMACAAGCCQFHGSPPGGGNGDGDDDDDGPGHGHGGHGGHGGGHGHRPPPPPPHSHPRPERD